MKWWLFFASITFSLCGCDTLEKNYNSFYEIPSSDGIKSWLPDFFPENSIDIKFKSNLDLNSFSVYFSIPEYETRSIFLESKNASSDGFIFMKKQDGDINIAMCANSNYNLFKEKNHMYFLIGFINKSKQYYLINITDKQYDDFC